MKAPRCMATMIGSLPHTDPAAAVKLVLDNLDEAPIWPELPRHGWREGFIEAHVDGLPGLRVDDAAQRVFVDTAAEGLADAMAAFYERAMAAEAGGDLQPFAITEAQASAFEVAVRAIADTGRRYPVVKTHGVGPVSLQLTLTDASDRPLYYDEGYQDVLVRQVALRARWAVRRLAPLADRVIAFFDEPTLAAFGSSAYVGVLREDVVARLGAAIQQVQAEGAVAGVHVCGNSDWPMIIDAGADLINYDAWEYGESMLMYADRVGPFLEGGGVLAWGLVPTNPAIRETSAAALEQRFFELVDGLAAKGVDRALVLERSMITPSCGMGAMSPEDSDRVVATLSELSRAVQSKVR